MVTANLHRGDIEVLLGGSSEAAGGQRSYLLRPTFGGLAVMEAMSGDGVFALVRRIAAGEPGFTDTTAIIAGGLEGGAAGGLRGLFGDGSQSTADGPPGARDSPRDRPGVGPHHGPPDGLGASRRDWAWQRVAALVFETGFLGLVVPASELLWHAVKGDEEFAAGEAKAGNG